MLIYTLIPFLMNCKDIFGREINRHPRLRGSLISSVVIAATALPTSSATTSEQFAEDNHGGFEHLDYLVIF